MLDDIKQADHRRAPVSSWKTQNVSLERGQSTLDSLTNEAEASVDDDRPPSVPAEHRRHPARAGPDIDEPPVHWGPSSQQRCYEVGLAPKPPVVRVSRRQEAGIEIVEGPLGPMCSSGLR